jgi:hypothetical protein
MKSFIRFYFDFSLASFLLKNPINFNCKTKSEDEEEYFPVHFPSKATRNLFGFTQKPFSKDFSFVENDVYFFSSFLLLLSQTVQSIPFQSSSANIINDLYFLPTSLCIQKKVCERVYKK